MPRAVASKLIITLLVLASVVACQARQGPVAVDPPEAIVPSEAPGIRCPVLVPPELPPRPSSRATHFPARWTATPCPGLPRAERVPFEDATVGLDDRTIAIYFLSSPSTGCGQLEHIEVESLPDRVRVTVFLSQWIFSIQQPSGASIACPAIGKQEVTWAVSSDAINGRPIADGFREIQAHGAP